MTLGRVAVAAGLLLAVAVVVVWARRRSDGEAYEPPVARIPVEDLPPEAQGGLAVLGFRSRFCVACRRTPDVVAEALGLAQTEAAFVHVDVADRLDLAQRLGLRQTPTVVLVDGQGRIRYAEEGNPDPGELAAYLREAAASTGR